MRRPKRKQGRGAFEPLPKNRRTKRQPPAGTAWLSAPPLTPQELAQISQAVGANVHQSPSGTLVVPASGRMAAETALQAVMQARAQRQQVRAALRGRNFDDLRAAERWALVKAWLIEAGVLDDNGVVQ